MKRNRIHKPNLFFPGRQLLLLFFCCCLWLTGQAQEDTTIIEKMNDTTSVLEPPPAQEEMDSDEIKEEKGNSFLYRSLQANGGGPESMQVRTVPDSSISRLLKDDNFWYVNEVFEKRKQEEQQSDTATPAWLNTLLWVVIIGSFAAFLIWFLISSDINVFRKSSRAITGQEEDETIPEDIFQIQYEKEIAKAIRNGNYRLAVRLHYLQLLRKMADRQIITYKHDSTNFDYIMQLYKTRYYNDFFRITRHYEYSWYGHFDVSPGVYEAIQAEVINFDKQLN